MYKQGLILALQIASHLVYMIMIPLLLFGGSGLWLDRRFNSLPEFLLIGIVLALLVTILWMKKQFKSIIELSNKK